MNETPSIPKRVCLGKRDLEDMTKEELQQRWNEQDAYIDALASGQAGVEGNRQQYEAARRENVLVMRLTTKEQEMQEIAGQIEEMKRGQNPNTAHLRTMLLDPAINLMFQRMKKETDICREKLEQAQNDLAAWKFTPDGQTGKRLMAKCRMLLQENEELGKVISSGRTAKLEGEIALEKKFVEEMKASQSETDEFLQEMDEEVEGMQGTIFVLQQQLKDAKEQVLQLQQENQELRANQLVSAIQEQRTLNQQQLNQTDSTTASCYSGGGLEVRPISSHSSNGFTPPVHSTESNIISALGQQQGVGAAGEGGSWTSEGAEYVAPITVEPIGMVTALKEEHEAMDTTTMDTTTMDTTTSSVQLSGQQQQQHRQEVTGIDKSNTTTHTNHCSTNSSTNLSHSPNSTTMNDGKPALSSVSGNNIIPSASLSSKSTAQSDKDTVPTVKTDSVTGSPIEEPIQNGLISSQYDSQGET